MGAGDPRVGRAVGKYTLVRVVGTGGMATVYEAQHRNGHRVALKMLKSPLAVTAEIRDRFLREGYAANKVQHAGAVRILDDEVTSDGHVFLVMELLDGETLDALAKERGGKLPLPIVLGIGKQLLEVLAVAHDAGVVHRDIKPENVCLLPTGQLKVLDFGIARVLEPTGASTTATGRMLGTPAFMPPEQAYGRRDEIDARSDLWAVGATLFTAIAGRVVHEAPTAEETLIKAATEPAPSLATVVPDAPPAVAALVDRALLAERDARWQSARDMLAALEAAYQAIYGVPAPSLVEVDGMIAASEVHPAPLSSRRRSLVGWTAIAVSAVALVSVAKTIRADGANVARPLAATPEPRGPAATPEPRGPAATPEPAAKNVEAPAAPPPSALGGTAVATPSRVAPRPVAPKAAPPPVAPPEPAAASAAPPAQVICGFDIDEEGRKWPRRCP